MNPFPDRRMSPAPRRRRGAIVTAGIVAATVAAVVAAAPSRSARAGDGARARAQISAARRALAAGARVRAETLLVDALREAPRPQRAEAAFLLAGIVRDGRRAEGLYRRCIEADPGGPWARRARLEIARIAYATGRYGSARAALAAADACAASESACLLEGLAALEDGDDEAARRTLGRVRPGRERIWAELALAELEARAGDARSACRRYEALARAHVSPTAMFRWGECLENAGRSRDARSVYRDIVEEFAGTPEAVRARAKLEPAGAAASGPGRAPAARPVNAEPVGRLERGFTIQFGAFGDRGNAIRLAARLRRVQPGIRIDTELVRYREVHRVRYGYFTTREDAERKAREIAARIDEPWTIMPIGTTP